MEALAVEEREFVVTAKDVKAVAEGDEQGEIRVTLVWMDPAVPAFASSQLLHDLDLFLEGPDGTIWTM